jgi:hypothetical protein
MLDLYTPLSFLDQAELKGNEDAVLVTGVNFLVKDVLQRCPLLCNCLLRLVPAVTHASTIG